MERSSLFRRTALHALKSTHPVSRSVLPPLSERVSQIKSLYRSFFLYQQPTTHNLPRFLPPAERNWHREAILACASRLAKAKPLLAAGCSSCQKWSLSRFLVKPLLAAGCPSRQKWSLSRFLVLSYRDRYVSLFVSSLNITMRFYDLLQRV